MRCRLAATSLGEFETRRCIGRTRRRLLDSAGRSEPYSFAAALPFSANRVSLCSEGQITCALHSVIVSDYTKLIVSCQLIFICCRELLLRSGKRCFGDNVAAVQSCKLHSASLAVKLLDYRVGSTAALGLFLSYRDCRQEPLSAADA